MKDEKHYVEDYDFHFGDGQFLGVTVDVSLGDTIQFGDKEIKVYLSPKESVNQKDSLVAEEIIVLRELVPFYTKRIRLAFEQTKEEAEEWSKTIAELTKDTKGFKIN